MRRLREELMIARIALRITTMGAIAGILDIGTKAVKLITNTVKRG